MRNRLGLGYIIFLTYLATTVQACGCGDRIEPSVFSSNLLSDLIIVAFASYVIGSIPFGLIVTQMMGIKDIRNIGSGNTGATNVMRAGGKFPAIATLLLDGLKGFIPVFTVLWTMDIHPERALIYAFTAMLFAIIGHCFPVWLKFKGGKGVATYLGTLFGASYLFGIGACAIWLATFLISRISSLAAMVVIIVGIIINVFAIGVLLFPPSYEYALNFLIPLFASFIIIYQHRENIKRLRNGTEPKFTLKKSDD